MSLTIVRDRPSVRRAYGINAPLFVSVAGGERIRAHEWSHVGLVLDRDVLPPLDGGLAHVTLHLNFQGYEIGVPVRAKEDLTGEVDPGPDRIRLEFVDLPQRSAELIEHFVEDFVRGRIVPAQDTLVRIDAPAEPISTKPDKKPDDGAKDRIALKPILMTALYLVLGTLVMGYIAVLLYTNYVRLEVRTAVVSRPIETLRVNTNATISEVLKEPGDLVSRGEVVARLADPELEERIARAEAVVETAVNATRRARRRLAIDQRRIKDYRALDDAERTRTMRDLERARERWWRTLARLRRAVVLPDGPGDAAALIVLPGDRFATCEGGLKEREWADLIALRIMLPAPQTLRDLRRADLVTCRELGALYREHARLREDYREAVKQAKRRFRIDRLSDVRLFNGREFVVDLDVALLERDKAKAKETEARAMVDALRTSRSRGDIRAASGGRVVEMLAVPKLPMTRGDTLAVIEADVPPVIDVYLTQEEAEVVALGDRVDVYVPALDRRLDAVVARIDRTEGFRDEQRDQVVWRGPKDRSALATLRLEEDEVTGDLRTGLPVTALFHRRGASAGPSVVESYARSFWRTDEPPMALIP